MKAVIEFKAGDLVEITSGDTEEEIVNGEFYSTGDRCVLNYQDESGDWWAEFDGQGNASVYKSIAGNSEWCIGNPSDFRLVGGDK